MSGPGTLARATALKPELLIADEAMAGLSNTEVDQILALLFRLNAGGTTIIMIEHVMRAVTEFSQRLAVLVAGKKVADGDPRTAPGRPDATPRSTPKPTAPRPDAPRLAPKNAPRP